MASQRSTASLLAAGLATITLDQRLEGRKVRSTLNALRADREALVSDGRRVKRHLTGVIGHR